MKTKNGLYQEQLKAIACAAMLLDHIGAVFYPQRLLLRMVGRTAFPIYCFLLAEGAHYTKSHRRYALRLLTGAAISELPFDLALFGCVTVQYSSVMLTLLLGYGAIWAMGHLREHWRGLAVLAFFLLAELLHTDYGGGGVVLMMFFYLCREKKWGPWPRFLGLGALLWLFWPSPTVFLACFHLPLELFGVLALIPISFYRGEKRSHALWAQWGFYLFYPAHLLVLWALAVRIG